MTFEKNNILTPENRAAIVAYVEQQKQKTLDWVAEDPDNRCGGYAEPEWVIEDLEKWTTVQTLEDYLAYEAWLDYYELYKDKHGIKPRWTSWNEHTESEWKNLIEQL